MCKRYSRLLTSCLHSAEVDRVNPYITQETGHGFSVSGTLQTVYGTIAAVSADNPASNALGGFKEGFTAFRHCRQCMGTH